MSDIQFTVTHLRDNEDGSADFTFNISDEQKNNIVRWAIVEMLRKAIEEGKNLDPGKDNLEDA
jgi:hypothetical protein